MASMHGAYTPRKWHVTSSVFLYCFRARSRLSKRSSPLSSNRRSHSSSASKSTFRHPPASMARLDFTSTGTAEANGLKLIRYVVHVSGLPTAGPYFLMTWDIGTTAPQTAMSDLHIDGEGKLRCDDKKGCQGSSPGAQVVIGLTGAPGQPRRFVLTGADKKPLAMGEVVPFPASGVDGSCSAEAVLLSPKGEAVLVLGGGFQSSEAVHLESSCWSETVSSTRNADASGDYKTIVLPFVKGHDEGDTQITLNGTKCHPHTVFHWGSYQEVKAGSAAPGS